MATPDYASDSPSDASTMRQRVGPVPSIFSAYFTADSNSTASNLPGPGRVLGQVFAVGGRRIEVAMSRATARAGLGFQGAARTLLLRLRGQHEKCRNWPSFTTSPIVELAIELGHGCCEKCRVRYLSTLGQQADADFEGLLKRVIPAIE
jgi:hypothetical protein